MKITRLLPRRLVRGVRHIYLMGLDAVDRLCGRADDLTPPRALHFVGGGDFKKVGGAFLEHFIREGGLKAHETVLDIGCGTGRMAIPLLDFLDEGGFYTGFDVSREAIAWCQDHITSRNPRFRFEYADVYNLEYNPGGSTGADQYRFPLDDESVDFVFATSVFTHMHANEIRQYLLEIRRVLRSRGRAMLTFFAIDGQRSPATSRPTLEFRFPLPEGNTVDPSTPERAIGYSANWIEEAIAGADLRMNGPIRFGTWTGRQDGLDFQDVVIVGRGERPQ